MLAEKEESNWTIIPQNGANENSLRLSSETTEKRHARLNSQFLTFEIEITKPNKALQLTNATNCIHFLH